MPASVTILSCGKLALFEYLVKGSQHREIATARTPCRVVSSESFLGELLAFLYNGDGIHFKTPSKISRTLNVSPSVFVKLRILGLQYLALRIVASCPYP